MQDKTPINRQDDHELLGYVVKDHNSWVAQTIFGATIERTTSKEAAEKVIRSRGLSFLQGVWQYLDPADKEWHTCVIQEAYESQVKVMRTNAMGYIDPDDRKNHLIKHPNETNFIKIS
jgi:hypothetical protein